MMARADLKMILNDCVGEHLLVPLVQREAWAINFCNYLIYMAWIVLYKFKI